MHMVPVAHTMPEPDRQSVWKDLETSPEDIVIVNNRYGALIAGSSTLEPMLRNDERLK